MLNSRLVVPEGGLARATPWTASSWRFSCRGGPWRSAGPVYWWWRGSAQRSLSWCGTRPPWRSCRDASAPVRAWQVVPVLARREAGGDRRKETARHEPEDNLEQGRLHPKTYVTENRLLVGAGDNIQFLRSCSLLSTQSLCAIFEWLTSSLHHLR